MMWPQLQIVAQTAIGRTLNSLPEGLLVAAFTWAMLRFLPRQNSGTRFAVWLAALLAVAGLPLIGGIVVGGVTGRHSLLPVGVARPLVTLSSPWGLLLFLAWILAATVAILRLATGLWRLRKLRMSSVVIDGADLDPKIQKTVADFTSSRSVTLATSARVNVPAVIGFFKPMIVIPSWALGELPSDELNTIVLHELAHLRRWDDWTNLLQKIVQAVFLFHPAVWWIESRLSLEREMACDDQVLAETANPRGYAKCLLTLLERSCARHGWTMAQAAVHRAHEASLRLAQILDVSRPNTKHVWKPALGLVGVFSLVCLMVVPRAPQFVAFEWNAQAAHSDDVQSAAFNPPRLPAASAIPAALRTSSPLEKMPQHRAALVAGRAVEHLSEHRHTAPQAVGAGWSGAARRSPVEVVTAGAKQTVVPEVQTLLLIQTTQRTGPNSWMWSVCVWRLMWVNPNQVNPTHVPERAPAANKT